MNFAAVIKDRVKMRDVVENYGLTVNRNGFCRCPFHNERTPSFRVYDDSFNCFGCGEHGDVIDFVMKSEGVVFQEACKIINDRFSLGLPIGRQPRQGEAREAARRAYEARKKREAERQAAEDAESAFWRAYDAWLENDKAIRKNAPISDLEPFCVEYGKAVGQEALLEWELEQAEIRLYESTHKNV